MSNPFYVRNGSVWSPASGVAGAPGQGIPAGGSAGQALEKASAADYDTAWGAAPSGGGGGDLYGMHGMFPFVGGFVSSDFIGDGADSSTSSYMTSNISLMSFLPRYTFTCDAVHVRCITGAAGAEFTVGVYAKSAGGWITGDPLFVVNLPMTTPGDISAALSPNFQFVAGTVYFIAQISNSSSVGINRQRKDSQAHVASTRYYTQHRNYRYPYTYNGTLPNAESSGMATFSESRYNVLPVSVIHFRVASVP